MQIPNENLAVPSRTTNYITQNFQQYNGTLSTLEIYLSQFKIKYFERIETLQLNEDFLDEELNKALRQINPLEALDDVNSFCVNKYRGNLPELNIVKTTLASCNEKANNAYNSIVSAPLTTLRNLRNYYANQFSNELKACAKRHENNETLYGNCVVTTVVICSFGNYYNKYIILLLSFKVKSTNSVTTNNIKIFHNQLKQCECTARYKIKETFDCLTPIVFSSLSKIGAVIGMVESCVAGHEFCPTTGETVDLGRCPSHMSLHVGDDGVIKADEMQQLLKGVGKTSPCLQINFIRKDLAPV